MEQIVECVPNFSEGRDREIIDTIANSITGVNDVELLDVDPGADTNRTVITFVGSPKGALEAAFIAIRTAAELIDMSKHKGAHARMGATDVCPFIPVSGITMDECIDLAKKLGKRIGDELGIPVYLYENAATSPDRINLASVRQGEYEGLSEKLIKPEWKPDFGPAEFNPRHGATAIGARKFLIAYNININSRSQILAHNIALDIREKGRWLKDEKRKIVRDKNGKKLRKKGLLKACKAVGWFIDEYDRAQISMNLTDFDQSALHNAFEACEESAKKYGVRITGSELVGLVPLEAILEAGRFYLKKQGLSTGIPKKMIVNTAIQSLGLNEITPFEPDEKIIEYKILKGKSLKLVDMTCIDFSDELSIDSPAPGGGSVAALCGSLGASLVSMVANLTQGKREFKHLKSDMISAAILAQKYKDAFLIDVDKDTDAFNELMSCFSLPKKSSEQKEIRDQAIENATQNAIRIPFNVLARCLEVLDIAEIVALNGNPNSVSDAGVAVLTTSAAGEGAYMNVVINLESITDRTFADEIKSKSKKLREKLHKRSAEVAEIIYDKLNIKSPVVSA